MSRRIGVGTSSWTDPTLVKDSDFYPARSMSAEDRLRYYSSIFPVVEVDATYYRPPSEDVARLWVERTPPGFRFHIKSYGLFTGHPTDPQTLWPDVAEQLPAEHREKRRVYGRHLPQAALDLAWGRFLSALEPLRQADKLAAVVFQMPPWFTAKRANRDQLAAISDRMQHHRAAVELRHASWMADEERERTLSLLEQLDLTYVCVDEPQGFKTSVPPVVAATSELAMVRFHGHNAESWHKKGITAAERFRYLYDEQELRQWVEPIRELAGSAEETHALMNNCYRDFGVRNARQLGDLLGEGLQPGAPPLPDGPETEAGDAAP